MTLARQLLWTVTTDYPSMDFETYSEAGFVRDPLTGKVSGVGKNKSGIGAVGAAVYAEHPTCRIISLAYNLKDGTGEHLWLPCGELPYNLFKYILNGGKLQAWHSYFEYKVWKEVCKERMMWPELPLDQLVDVAAKARAFCLPGALAKAGTALDAVEKKMESGKDHIKYFCCPRSHTKKNKSNFNDPLCDPKGPEFYQYNIQDIRTESGINDVLPDLSPFEQEVFLLDQRINERGVRIDVAARDDLWCIVEQAITKYAKELHDVTGGIVQSGSEVANILKWLEGNGVRLNNLQGDTIDDLLPTLPDGPVKRVLELRQMLCSASVKKLSAMKLQTGKDNRAREQFTFCGADRTGRFKSGGIQLHNFPKDGIDVIKCENGCGHYYAPNWPDICPWCGIANFLNPPVRKWTSDAVDDVLIVATHRNLEMFEHHFGNALVAIQGCLRGLLTPAPGNQFVCSDFSAIEAVVTAEMAGEKWRQDLFRTHGKIYEMSASKISGIPFEEFTQHKERTGEHHPLRSKLGKVAELASGFKGWVGAWKKFGADKYFTNDDDIKKAILKWRDDNPAIVALWDAVELAFYSAVNNPTERYFTHGLGFGMADNRLFIQLPSGRKLVYHQPIATREPGYYGKYNYTFTYMRWNMSKKKGPVNAWVRVGTWVGETVENIVQAIARDILCFSMVNLDKAGYHIVLHVHDEPCAEVPVGFGSIEEFERIGGALPDWCKKWPVKMRGGWIGQRFKKD